MIEELIAKVCGVDVDENFDNLDEILWDKFEIDYSNFERLVNKLLPLCEVGQSPLTGIKSRGFADTKDHCWIMRIEVSEQNTEVAID